MATLYGTIGRSTPQAGWAEGAPDSSQQFKDFVSNMATHVPSEVVAVFSLGLALAPDYTGYWMIFCWISAVALRWWATNGEGKVKNVILAGIAFPIWAFALGGNLFGWAPDPQLVSLSVLGFSVIGGFLYNNK